PAESAGLPRRGVQLGNAQLSGRAAACAGSARCYSGIASHHRDANNGRTGRLGDLHAPDSETWSGRMHPPACVIHHPEHHLVLKWLRRSETTPTTATMVPALTPCSNDAWRFLKLPDAGSFPLDYKQVKNSHK